MTKKIVVLFLILILNNSFAQSNSDIKLNYVFGVGIGDNFSYCYDNLSVKLKVNDTTFIPFNERSTFEHRLNLSSNPIFLKRGKYLVILTAENNKTIQEQYFHTDSIDQKGQVIIDFQIEECCKKEIGRFLFFEPNSAQIVNRECSNIDLTIKLLSESKKNFKLIGIVSDSAEYKISTIRIENLKQKLIENGISQKRLTTEIVFENGYFKWGPLYQIITPKDCLFNGHCKLGIVIKQVD